MEARAFLGRRWVRVGGVAVVSGLLLVGMLSMVLTSSVCASLPKTTETTVEVVGSSTLSTAELSEPIVVTVVTEEEREPVPDAHVLLRNETLTLDHTVEFGTTNRSGMANETLQASDLNWAEGQESGTLKWFVIPPRDSNCEDEVENDPLVVHR